MMAELHGTNGQCVPFLTGAAPSVKRVRVILRRFVSQVPADEVRRHVPNLLAPLLHFLQVELSLMGTKEAKSIKMVAGHRTLPALQTRSLDSLWASCAGSFRTS